MYSHYWTRWWTTCPRRWICPESATNPDTGEVMTATADDQAPLVALVFKIQDRPVRETVIYQDTSVPWRPAGRSTTPPRAPGAHRAAGKDARQRPQGYPLPMPVKSRPSSGSRNRDRRYPCRRGPPTAAGADASLEPVISSAIEPEAKDDQDRLSIALHRLAEEARPSAPHGYRNRPDPDLRHG